MKNIQKWLEENSTSTQKFYDNIQLEKKYGKLYSIESSPDGCWHLLKEV